MRFNKILLFCIIITILTLTVNAAQNDTVPSYVNITGNIPSTTIFLDEVGQDGTDNSITLLPNQTIKVACWGTAFDLDGLWDLNDVDAWIYAESSSRDQPDNNSIHYTNKTCDISNLETTGEWNCTFDVWFYAENSTWTCIVNISDDENYFNDTANDTATIQDLVAVNVGNNSIDFGTKAVGVSYPANVEVLVYNEGNVELDLQLDAWEQNATQGSETDSDMSFNCTIGQIPVDYLVFNVTPTSFDAAIPMVDTGATSPVQFDLAHQEGGGNDRPTNASTYWGIRIPYKIAGLCTGYIRYIGVAGGP